MLSWLFVCVRVGVFVCLCGLVCLSVFVCDYLFILFLCLSFFPLCSLIIQIDAAFGSTGDSPGITKVSPGIKECTKAGLSVMTRKDNRLIDWWDPAFEQLKSSAQWPEICKDLTEEHGKNVVIIVMGSREL